MGISPLIPTSAFEAFRIANGWPAGPTPIAFVDPGDNRSRRLVAAKQGAILVWDGATSALLNTPFLDLRDSPDGSGPVYDGNNERGLLAMAADPEYLTNGRLYVLYTRGDGDVVIARYTRSADDPDVGDLASATVLLVIDHPATTHNGGWLAFGPHDGFLYISTGDGGGICDGNQGANGNSQRNDTLHGKLLRIDVRGIDPDGTLPDSCGTGSGYTVPSTNPLVGVANACDEVFAKGLRNPFRFGFDRLTGDLYVGDVGQANWEEIDLLQAGAAAPRNFGWSCREGCGTSNNAISSCQVPGCPTDTGVDGTCQFPRATGFYDPILCHENRNPITSSPSWQAIMGGYRYRGSYVPSIAGAYFYGDAFCGQIWKTTTLDPANPAAVDSACWASGFAGTYGFAEDHLGELYVVSGSSRRVDCIHNGAGCFWAGFRGLFEDDFESGGTTHWSGSTP